VKGTHAMLQLSLATIQLAAGDRTDAKFTAEAARNTLGEVSKTQSDQPAIWFGLAQANALMGEKESARKAAERAIMLFPSVKDVLEKAVLREQLAVVQTSLGDNSRAISNLAELLQTPYSTGAGRTPITPALLRLDPIWDPLRSDPAFQKLCEDKLDKSIAVLPFENLSADPENAYFADGIQDEILTRLSKLADLKVISRTSTQRYKSAPENLPEIAKQLGVAHILEGRVQRSGDTVRVNVQLIKAANDSHLWADSFDRKLTDVFSVESEVAKAIADQLRG
jgi:TolB-like protein